MRSSVLTEIFAAGPLRRPSWTESVRRSGRPARPGPSNEEILMARISRGFGGRRREEAEPGRLPPGQYLTRDFPVLSAGPTPHPPLQGWSFTVGGAVGEGRSWTWDELLALPADTFTVDIHCVTKWSKFDTTW